MKAVILIGGKAERLRPLTLRRPKAIVPILSRPFLATQIELLRAAGITDIVLCLASLPRQVEAVFGNGGAFGVSLRYAVEPEPLGTAGALGHIRSQLDETFLCMNGDVLTDLDASALVAAHEEAGALLTLSLTRVRDASAFGVVRTAPARGRGPAARTARVVGFDEKPAPTKSGAASRDRGGDISVGVYVMEPRILDSIPDGGPASLERQVFPQVIAAGEPVAAYHHSGYFSDIGTPSRYHAAHRDALDGRIRIPGVRSPNPGGVIVDETATVHRGARLAGPAFVGPGALLREGARVGPYAVLGRRVRVEADASVRNSILWADTRIGEGAEVSGSILGLSSFVGPRARLSAAVLGDKSTVGAESVIPWAG